MVAAAWRTLGGRASAGNQPGSSRPSWRGLIAGVRRAVSSAARAAAGLRAPARRLGIGRVFHAHHHALSAGGFSRARIRPVSERRVRKATSRGKELDPSRSSPSE